MAVAAKSFASHSGTLLCMGNIRRGCHSGTSNRLAAARVAEKLVESFPAQYKQKGFVAPLPRVDKHSTGMGSIDMGSADHKDNRHKIPLQHAHAHDQPMPFRTIEAKALHSGCKFA